MWALGQVILRGIMLFGGAVIIGGVALLTVSFSRTTK